MYFKMAKIKSKRWLLIIIALESLLLIPLIAMQFTTEVDWKNSDFIIFGVLFLVVGLLAELIFRKIKNQEKRIILIAFLIVVFLLIWAELGVGIFGSPLAGN